MATLEGFLDELIGVVRAASGIRYAPDDPPSAIATDPAAVVWVTNGRILPGPWSTKADGSMAVALDYHHSVRVGLLTSMQNIALANQRILPKIETVIEAIHAARPYANCENIEEVAFTYGPIQWGDVWYFGAIIDLGDVKIQRTS